MVIFYKVEYIDGANGSVLGAAGVKYRRKGGRSLPLVGQMLFDAADLAALPPRQRAAFLSCRKLRCRRQARAATH